MTDPARVIGVLGAGTMGWGIAQLACQSGASTLLYDPIPEALTSGVARLRAALERHAARGRLTGEQAREASERVVAITDLAELASCELVIEAVPERLELKHQLFRQLCEIVGEDCVLATNTSSLAVTAIAAAASRPERVVGMHFFNPAPVMRLVEVIAGVHSAEEAISLADATGQAMGKTVIRAADGPGFLVNRCNRPFGLEALSLLSEGAAPIEEIDRVCRTAGRFRMGPFELSDLVGIDTGLEIAKSFYDQSFGEPRWRPSPIQARYVAAGLYGRKNGRGYYDYRSPSSSYRLGDPSRLPPARGEGVVVIEGQTTLAGELRLAAAHAGYEVKTAAEQALEDPPVLSVDCGLGRAGDQRSRAGDTASGDALRGGERPVSSGGPHIILCATGSLTRLDQTGQAIGFHVLPPFTETRLVELTVGDHASSTDRSAVEDFFATLSKQTAWVGDAPGLILGRIVCQLVNEAAFALGEGVGSARDIDTGMVLGLNHPRGPLSWADAIGLDHVLGVLDGLWTERRSERYRPAPVLSRLVHANLLGRKAGAGFFQY